MPLSDLVLRTALDPEDADLLESLFNQSTPRGENLAHRRSRAMAASALLVDNKADRKAVSSYLMAPGQPSRLTPWPAHRRTAKASPVRPPASSGG